MVNVTPVGSDGTTYDVAVSGMTGSGTVVATIAAGKVHDAAGNPNTASTSTDNSVQYTSPPPSFALSGPIRGHYGWANYSIQWVAGNMKAGSKISLCYDADTVSNKNEHWIEIDGVKAANGNGSYAWNTTGVTPGTYYVAGYMWDGTTPSPRLISPRRSRSWRLRCRSSPDRPDLTHVSGRPDGQHPLDGQQCRPGSKISLCFDTDTTFNGNETGSKSTECRLPTVAAYAWNTTGMAPGTYYLAGYMWDGGNTFTMSHLTQAITITATLTNSTKSTASNSVKLVATNAVFANVGESLQSSVTNSVKLDWLYKCFKRCDKS